MHVNESDHHHLDVSDPHHQNASGHVSGHASGHVSGQNAYASHLLKRMSDVILLNRLLLRIFIINTRSIHLFQLLMLLYHHFYYKYLLFGLHA